MHMTVQILLACCIAYIVLSIMAIILISRAFYLRGIQKGWKMKEEQSEQGAQQTTQRTSNVFMRPIRAIWEPSAKRS